MQEDNEYLDEDGYPTEEAINKIKTWDWTEDSAIESFFIFLENIWHLKSWGWHSELILDKNSNREIGKHYYISTAGWSGNESLIRAFQENEWLWYTVWESSHRGGHYEFIHTYE